MHWIHDHDITNKLKVSAATIHKQSQLLRRGRWEDQEFEAHLDKKR